MTISAKRLTDLLVPQGFHFWYEHLLSGDIGFSRQSSVDDLFEHVWISTYGERRRTISSDSFVSVTFGPEMNHEFAVRKPHVELCSVPERHFSAISTRKEAVAWEKSLAAFVDQHLRSLTREAGPDLLLRSEHARSTARKYWMRLREFNRETNCEYLASQLMEGLSRDQLMEPDRIADAIVANLTMLPAYQVAAITVQMFSQEVEGIRDPFVGQRVHENDPLASLLSILADLLLREDVELCSRF